MGVCVWGYNHITTNYRTGPWVGEGEGGGNYNHITSCMDGFMGVCVGL